MHPELAGLLHTARYALDDDAPRMVVADWLEEHGDAAGQARAEYVRLSLRAARLAPWSPDYDAVLNRRRELEEAHDEAWFGPLRRCPGVTSIQHERGMACVHLDAAAPLKTLFALPDAAWVEGVRCWGWDGEAYGRLLRSSLCGRLGSLGLGDCRSADLRACLSTSRHLKGLRHLMVMSGQLTSGVWRQVMEAGRLGPLTRLCMLGNRLGRSAVASMAGVLREVVNLDLSQNQMAASGVAEVARLDAPRLRVLDLGWNQAADRGLTALARSAVLANVETLTLSSNGVGSAGLAALAASPHAGRLAWLDLSFNGVTADGAVALAGSPLAGRLRWLELRYNQVGDAGAKALLGSPLRGVLHRLDVSENGLSAGMKRRLKRAFGAALVV